jgi:hypothetical protein
VSLPVGVKLYSLPTVAEIAGVPEIVARAMVPLDPELLLELLLEVVALVSAAVAGEFTSTPSPPPHAAAAQETSKEAATALISLKVKSTLLPAAAYRGQQ